jgi:uncharacterized protein GlcG (DUF336 family)
VTLEIAPSIPYASAAALVAALLDEARRRSLRVTALVIDTSRDMVAFGRMDGAIPASVEIAYGKAYTAAMLQRDTVDVAPETLPGGPLFGLQGSHRQAMVTFGGGRVLHRDGRALGAVAVAGGTPEQAEQILDAVLPSWLSNEIVQAQPQRGDVDG